MSTLQAGKERYHYENGKTFSGGNRRLSGKIPYIAESLIWGKDSADGEDTLIAATIRIDEEVRSSRRELYDEQVMDFGKKLMRSMKCFRSSRVSRKSSFGRRNLKRRQERRSSVL